MARYWITFFVACAVLASVYQRERMAPEAKSITVMLPPAKPYAPGPGFAFDGTGPG
jgi:hypothetical protein